MHQIEIELKRKILILDGAMGTMIQTYDLKEEDFRNSALQNNTTELKGNSDLLNITRPDVIRQIHLQYLLAGADIISTNTFGANEISQDDYKVSDWVYDINYAGAKIAKEAVLQFQKDNPKRTCFVAGAMGPTTKLASISPDVENPAFRAVNFDQLVIAYIKQAKALVDGGVDLFLLETITDTLNAKAALFALMSLFEEMNREYPVMISATIVDASGRILSGQTLEAFLISISHSPVLSVGLNCSLGAAELRPYIYELDRICPFYVSLHPNAGLPNQFGNYDQSPEEFTALITTFCENSYLNIVGGCCGTTPKHIRAIVKALKNIEPRPERSGANLKVVSDDVTKRTIRKWETRENEGDQPTFSLKELMDIVSKIEDEQTFFNLKIKFDKEKKLYQQEQEILLNAHIFGRYKYLSMENRLKKLA